MKQKRKDKIIDKETNFATKVVRKLKNIDIFIPIIIALSLINPLRAAISQYYILPYRDDIMWISWASKHYNQISDILFTKLGTGLRPMMNFWYAFGFSLWGSNEKGYFILNGLLFAGSMLFLYLLIKQLHSRMAGIISVLLFLFLDATFILVWKLNYISSIGEIFFITSSLYFSIRFFEKKERICILLAIILAILAFLSKEESIIIIPTINIIYLFHKWESIGKKTRTVALALNIFPIILFYIFNMFYIADFIPSATTSISEYAKSRLTFYIDEELSGQLRNPYIIIFCCAITFYFYKPNKKDYFGIASDTIRNVIPIMVITLSVISFNLWITNSLPIAIIIIGLLFFGFIFGDIGQRIGIAWFLSGVIPLIIVAQPTQPTYLAEPNLGMVLFIGITISKYINCIFSLEDKNIKQKNFISHHLRKVNIILFLIIISLQLSAISGQITDANFYYKKSSESEKSFKESVDYLRENVPLNGTIFYISSEKREKLGGVQIDTGTFYDLLCLKGRCDINVKSLPDIETNSNVIKGGYIALLSNLDLDIFYSEYYPSIIKNDLLISMKLIKNGDSGAAILVLK